MSTTPEGEAEQRIPGARICVGPDCGANLTELGRRAGARHCSPACRQAAWRSRTEIAAERRRARRRGQYARRQAARRRQAAEDLSERAREREQLAAARVEVHALQSALALVGWCRVAHVED